MFDLALHGRVDRQSEGNQPRYTMGSFQKSIVEVLLGYEKE